MAKVIDVGAESEKFSTMFRDGEIVQYGRSGDGTRTVRVNFKRAPVDISVNPRTYGGEYLSLGGTHELSWTPEEASDAALAVASAIKARLGQFDYDCTMVKAAVADRRAAVLRADTADKRLAVVLGAKNPQPSLRDMLLRGGESSERPVWLHGWVDKDKGGAAFGYHFKNPAEFWRAHPEYRPVEWGCDEHGPWMRLQVVTFASPEVSNA